MKRVNIAFRVLLLACVFMVSCTTPPPANSTSMLWPIAEQIKSDYIPAGVSDYVILDIISRGFIRDSLKRGGVHMTLLFFKQHGETKLYSFYTTDYAPDYIRMYRAEVLDTPDCYSVRGSVPQCILAIKVHHLEKSFYEKYVDSLWLIPANNKLEDRTKEEKYPYLYLNQHRGKQQRSVRFTSSDVAEHPILQQLIAVLKEEIGADSLVNGLFPPWPSDRLRLRAQGISYSSNTPGLSREEDIIILDTASWIDLKGVSDRTLREIHHLTSLNLEWHKYSSSSIPSNVHKLKRINLLVQTYSDPEILPDSFRLLQNLDTLVISADARVPEQLDIILSLKKLRWLVFWQPYTAAEIRDIIAEIETQNLPALQEVWFSCTDCYLENNADGVVETQNFASLPPRYVIKDYQAIKRKFGLIE